MGSMKTPSGKQKVRIPQGAKFFQKSVDALAFLEPHVKDGKALQTGRPVAEFGNARAREILGNWLVAAVCNAPEGFDRYLLVSDPTEDTDGSILDLVHGTFQPTEHIAFVCMEPSPLSGEERVLHAIQQKVDKGGKAYASGKMLVVLLWTASEGPWFPNKVARHLPDPIYFEAVWAISLQYTKPDGSYTYGVTMLKRDLSMCPSFLVHIHPDWQSWTVERMQ